MAVYFLGEDDQIYSASDVRPTGGPSAAQLARDAYQGGIEIGPLVLPAKQLARGLYLGADMTASRDGRLGRGKGVRIVEQGSSTWAVEAVQTRFRRPLVEQWIAIYENAALPADAVAAGWDFVFLEGSVVGAAGSELAFRIEGGAMVRLSIASESESLRFRENLQMLSRASGLRLRVIARMNLQDPTMAAALAIAGVEANASGDEPRLELPESYGGRVCLGFDEHVRASTSCAVRRRRCS